MKDNKKTTRQQFIEYFTEDYETRKQKGLIKNGWFKNLWRPSIQSYDQTRTEFINNKFTPKHIKSNRFVNSVLSFFKINDYD